MSATTTVEYLSEDMLTRDIPCEILLKLPPDYPQCGKPAVVRLHMKCRQCGRESFNFACGGCKHDRLGCYRCFMSGHGHGKPEFTES